MTSNFFVGFFGFPIVHSDPNDHYTSSDIISPVFDPSSQDYSGTGNAISVAGHVAGGAVFPESYATASARTAATALSTSPGVFITPAASRA